MATRERSRYDYEERADTRRIPRATARGDSEVTSHATGSTPGWLPMLHLWHRKGLDHAGVPLGGRAGNLAHGSPAAYTEQQAP